MTPTAVTPNQPLWGTETGTYPLEQFLEARGASGTVFGAPPAGNASVFELHAESPGGTVVEYIFASTTLPGGGPDRIPEVLVMVGQASDQISGGGDFCQIGGVPAVNTVKRGVVVGDPSVLNPGFTLRCPNRVTIPLVGPNDRYWSQLYTRVYVPSGFVLQIAARVDQYLEMDVVWREAN